MPTAGNLWRLVSKTSDGKKILVFPSAKRGILGEKEKRSVLNLEKNQGRT